jgi:NAD(P)-dependent dehydrogenase (short-subunit alcohol dehydrogenase family)
MEKDVFSSGLYKGKVVYVAGGTSGINLGIAKGYAEQGAQLVVVGRDLEKAERAADELRALGAEAIGLSADVRDPEAVRKTLEQTKQQFAEIDVLISGAAGNFLAPIKKLSPNAFKAVVDIDLLGTYNVFHLGFDYLKKPGAVLIAITAGQAVKAMPMQAHVCAAKAGVNMLVNCFALEWGPLGIRVVGISPGPIEDTEGVKRLLAAPGLKEAVVNSIPLRRMGEKSEVAKMALFASSDAAQYVSGTILDVDGAGRVSSYGVNLSSSS